MTRLAKRLFLLSLVVGAFGLAVAPVASAQDVDCDSVGQSEAQNIYNQDPSDPNNLDEDGDGIACEASETSQTTTDTTTEETTTDTTTSFANTGFEAWPIAVAGVVCLAGGLLLLMRRRRTT